MAARNTRELVENIRDLPFDDDLRETMASFSEVLSVPNATYMRFSKESLAPIHFSTLGFDREQAAANLAEHHDRNVWVDAMRRNNLKNGLILCSELYSWKTFAHSFWYNEVVRQDNLCDVINIMTSDPIQGEAYLSWYTTPEQGQFSRQSVEALQPYYRMLKKSMDLRMALDERNLELAFFNDVANRSGAFALCHLNGEVAVADRAFEQVLVNKEGLALVRNRIQPLDSQSKKAWQRQWALAKQPPSINSETSVPFQIKRSQSLTPLVAEMWLYQHKGGTVLKSENYILIRLQGASKGYQLPSAPVLIEAFSLSHAEASVALLLCEGLTPAQVALQRQTSLVTVRNQVRSVLTKMHLSSVTQMTTMVFALSR